LNPTVQLLGLSETAARHVRDALRTPDIEALDAEVGCLDPAAPLPPPRRGLVLVADPAQLSLPTAARKSLLRRSDVVVLDFGELEHTVRLFGEHDGASHILARDGDLLPRQLRTTLTQLLTRETLPLSGYLRPGTGIVTTKLTGSDGKDACVSRLRRDLAPVDAIADLPAIADTVASELIMNAVFNAPHDRHDRPKYRDVARHTSFSLLPGEDVTVSYGFDDAVFALSVHDNFGMLTRETLLANLLRATRGGASQINMRSAGAGIGFYMVLGSSNQLDVHVVRRRSTRMVAVIGLTRRHRHLEELGHSMNLFFVE
jgi:hypothetical protein